MGTVKCSTRVRDNRVDSAGVLFAAPVEDAALKHPREVKRRVGSPSGRSDRRVLAIFLAEHWMMRLLRRRWYIVVSTVVLVAATGAWFLRRNTAADSDMVVAPAKQGQFKVMVTTSGELRALKDVKITGPLNMQQAQIYNSVKIRRSYPKAVW